MMGVAVLLGAIALAVWTVYAQFESRCSACGERIYEGDEIVNVDGDWIHEECA